MIKPSVDPGPLTIRTKPLQPELEVETLGVYLDEA